MASSSVPSVDRATAEQLEAFVCATQQSMSDVASARSPEGVLSAVLDACCQWLGHLHVCFFLLDAQDDSLFGRMIVPQHTLDAVCKAIVDAMLSADDLANQQTNRPALAPTSVMDGTTCAIVCRIEAIDNLVARVFFERRPRVSSRFHDLFRPQVQAELADAVQAELGIRSVVLLPMCGKERCVGVFVVASDRSCPLTEQDLLALQVFAAGAAIGVEDARLRQELHDLEKQVSFLLKATIDAQEEERERICLDIHDGVAQTLTAAFHYLQTLDGWPELPDSLRTNVGKAGMLMRHAIREAREILASLRPAALDTLGLVATLRYEVDGLKAQMGWQVQFDADPVRFPKAVETALYRIVHEALTNVTKHARAASVVVRVTQEPEQIVVEVQDDGVGFDPHALDGEMQRNGLGLLSMRKRAELLQGRFRLTSSPRAGTRVRVEVPLSARERRDPAPPNSPQQATAN
ncbi:MAG: GAF domain-containing sensor histidine kinase [Chloroflexi bacterium]|nr:GAF domain-containing sensor histidine kinase [Chloroflexota bacterium]